MPLTALALFRSRARLASTLKTMAFIVSLPVATLLVPACSTTAAAPAAPPPADVSVIHVTPERVPLTSEWTGTLDGCANAQIRPQVTGYLIRRAYQEGAVVKKGQVLFEIDPRPFEAILAQAAAQLAAAQAQQGKTERDLQRDQPLAQEHAIAQSQLDNDIQANLAAQAAVKQADAAMQTAKLNLGFTHVVSLIDGVAAIATAQIGDLVSPTSVLTTVSQVNPIKAYFFLSEQEYLRIADRINRAGTSATPWTAGGNLTLILSDGSVYPEPGTYLAADRQVDPKTGTIRICATFPNAGHRLRPGQYGRVRADTRVLDHALLVPQRAVEELQGRYQLRIVTSANTLNTRPVTLADRVGSRWIVAEGLAPGERVVVEGAPQMRDGTPVNPKPFEPPTERP